MSFEWKKAQCKGRFLQDACTYYDLADAISCTAVGENKFTLTFGVWVPPDQLILNVEIMDSTNELVQLWKNAKANKYRNF